MLCGRLASLKDSTNPSYKKKTEERVGVTLTVKAMMTTMSKDFQRTNNRLRYNKYKTLFTKSHKSCLEFFHVLLLIMHMNNSNDDCSLSENNCKGNI